MQFLLILAIVLFTTKLFGILMKKLGLPQVLGSLLAGILLGATGLIKIIANSADPGEIDGLAALGLFATIGVNLIMFSAGMETNFKEIKKNGAASILITSLGVLIPFLVGFAVSYCIPGLELKNRMFFGVILTATSVGITVACLKEMGVLHGKVGASIVTAAILDDIIGVVILAFFTAEVSASTWGVKLLALFSEKAAAISGLAVFVNVILFFIVGIAVGFLLHLIFKLLSKKFPHTRRLSAFGLVICFLYAWGANALFGIADITGAFLAGMMLSNMNETEYVERRIDISAYMIFSPIFFANIGISLPYDQLVQNFSATLVIFSILFVIFGLAAKLVGCGVGAAICRYKPNQCVKVGVGMMVRGEVCLIVATEGAKHGLIGEEYFAAVILLIVVSSILTPIILKYMFKKYPNEALAADKIGTLDTVIKEQAAIHEVKEFMGGVSADEIRDKRDTQEEAIAANTTEVIIENPEALDDVVQKEESTEESSTEDSNKEE